MAILKHVNAALRLFELPEDSIQQFPKYINVTCIFRCGELLVLTPVALRDFGDLMTSRTISIEIVRWNGWDVNDPVLQSGITAKLRHVLLWSARRRLLTEH